MRVDELAPRLFELTAPGGVVLIYNLTIDPVPAGNALDRATWERHGFSVETFDQDDAGAARGLSAELGWKVDSDPLAKALRAKYTLLRRGGG
jgi:hypothetical protein